MINVQYKIMKFEKTKIEIHCAYNSSSFILKKNQENKVYISIKYMNKNYYLYNKEI